MNAPIDAPTGPATQNHPDAELMWLCAEIDRLEDEINSYRGDTVQLENEQNALAQPFVDQQAPLIERICDMTATTLEGLRARARTIVKWAPDLLNNPKDISDMMVSALLRDLVGEVRS